MSELRIARCIDVAESLKVHGKVADPEETISRSCVREVHRVPALSSTLHATREEEGKELTQYTDLMPNYLSLCADAACESGTRTSTCQRSVAQISRVLERRTICSVADVPERDSGCYR